ncbi:hypothetical protein D9619_011018 [Psilocybe cf. subviscida]|uniref:Uncharacterized protein n=1 Tax=Psilocybe cf. subviscida TaxID=2480587 RepID=A0A8H5B9R5_9AGAR|nr:hypothetical protein D9619_011018 [Psilocybe cf. subviscida]
MIKHKYQYDDADCSASDDCNHRFASKAHGAGVGDELSGVHKARLRQMRMQTQRGGRRREESDGGERDDDTKGDDGRSRGGDIGYRRRDRYDGEEGGCVFAST